MEGQLENSWHYLCVQESNQTEGPCGAADARIGKEIKFDSRILDALAEEGIKAIHYK